MSRRHPIISVTGSSGAGTTSVKNTFANIFRREKVTAAYIEGDAFHRYDRAEMRKQMLEKAERGNRNFSHFSPETNLFEELEKLFRDYGESGTGTTRHYIHDAEEAALHGGEGTLYKSIIDVFIMVVLGNALNLLNVDSYWQRVAIGAVIIAAAAADRLRSRS